MFYLVDSEMVTSFIAAGDVSSLRRILTPAKLYLKSNAPVIITCNVSHRLVNGTQARVTEAFAEHVTITTNDGMLGTLRKTAFVVYSPTSRKQVAIRYQLPLRLAFAMTIHKCQGKYTSY